MCWQSYFARQYDAAVAQARLAFDLDPDYMPARWCLGISYQAKGNSGEAIAELQRAVTLSGGNNETRAWLAYTYAATGEKDKALQILASFKNLAKHAYVSPIYMAEIYTGLGDKDQAFDWWTKARHEGATFVLYLRSWPANDTLRTDPRYRELLRGVGL
jgi:tetratricopeptide (TPR) repeat protein